MRPAGLLLLVAYLTTAGASRAETKFPYPLTVPAGGATLRSGPSLEFYPTDRLVAGSLVQVYRESQDGWLAVRPPPGSFSLVERRQLRAGAEPGIAVALTDDVLACIGSRAEAVRTYVSQVRLRKDEPVELLDKWDEESPKAEDQAWCRIAPPAGEFRWVQADEFKRPATVPSHVPPRAESESSGAKTDSPSPATAPKSSFETDGWVRVPADREKVAARPATEKAADRANSAVPATPKTPPAPAAAPAIAASTAPEADHQPEPTRPNTASPGISASASESPTLVPTVAIPAEAAPVAAAPAPVPTADQWNSRTPPPRQSIEELEVDLALMVAGDAQTWRLAELRRRVEVNLIRYQTTAERVQARRLLERIAEFEQLHSRVAQAATGPQTAPLTSPSASPPTSPPTVPASTEAAAGAADGVKYDGSGWLVPVHSTTGTAPPFALLDAQGEVLGYVSPTPGLNLQRYLRKQVGIFGLRGYVPTLNKPHVTAERVVELDRHLR
jgi:hypothetical protein